MPLPALAHIAGTIACGCGVLLAAHAWRLALPHVRLMLALAAFAAVMLALSLAGSAAAGALTPTLRFWHGMVSGMGIGALLGLLTLYARDRYLPAGRPG